MRDYESVNSFPQIFFFVCLFRFYLLSHFKVTNLIWTANGRVHERLLPGGPVPRGGGRRYASCYLFLLDCRPVGNEAGTEAGTGLGSRGGTGALRDSSRAIAPKKKKKIAVGLFVCFG